MSDPKQEEQHDSIWLLLPWYATGTLETAERRLVEDHLAGCPSCREEVARCNGLAAALRARPEIAPSPHPLQLARLMERLDSSDASDASEASEADDVITASVASDPITPSGAITASVAIPASVAGNAITATNANDADAGARRRQRGPSLLGGTPRLVRWALAGQLAALIL